MVLTRELTKVYEVVLRGKVSEIESQIGESVSLKGKSLWSSLEKHAEKRKMGR